MKLKQELKFYKFKLSKFFNKHKDLLKYFYGLIFIIVVYGVITNFVINNIFLYGDRGLTLADETFRSFAYGFVWYVIKVELPSIIKSCKKEK